MSHTHDDPRVTAYVFGELPAEQAIEFERELKASPALQQEVDGVRDAIAAVQHEFTTRSVSMSAAQLQAVEEAIQQQATTTGEAVTPLHRDTHRESSSRAPIIAVLAASVVLVAGLTFPYWYSNSGPEISMNQPEAEFEGQEESSLQSAPDLSQDDPSRKLGRDAKRASDEMPLADASDRDSSAAATGLPLPESRPVQMDEESADMDEESAGTGPDAPASSRALAPALANASATTSNLQRATSPPAIPKQRSALPKNELDSPDGPFDSIELQIASGLQSESRAENPQPSRQSNQVRAVAPGGLRGSQTSDEDISDLFGAGTPSPAPPESAESPAAAPSPFGDADLDDRFRRNSSLGGMNAPAKAKRSRSDATMEMMDGGAEMEGFDMEMGMGMDEMGMDEMEIGDFKGGDMDSMGMEDMEMNMGMGGAMMAGPSPAASRPSSSNLGDESNLRNKSPSFGFAEARPGTNASRPGLGVRRSRSDASRPGSSSGSRLGGGGVSREAQISRRMATPAADGLEAKLDSQRGILPGQDDMAVLNPAGDRFAAIHDNPFIKVDAAPLSTFSIDVDTASYGKIRSLLRNNALPNPNAVRIEELLNYFDYDYPAPKGEHPFEASMEIAQCPWNGDHRLARIGIQAEQIDTERPASNLVFLLDVSGSMNNPDKLPLMVEGMKLLARQLSENDRVAIVVYAGAAGLVLDSITGDNKELIIGSLDRLHAGGSTNGGQGIKLAYSVARDHFIEGGVNRIILCSDGDFNVGVTGTKELVEIAKTNAKSNIFLSVLGFGTGNHNDAMMEKVSNDANGNYAFIDSKREAEKVLVDEIGSTLVAVAKDVKIQVEFNPSHVAAYRLIGYENRIMAAADYANDAKDGGEIGAGHTVTALYEIVPTRPDAEMPQQMDDLRYQTPNGLTKRGKSDEFLCLKLRYKQPEGAVSTPVEFPIYDDGKSFAQSDRDFQFAAAVAGFGMLLRDSPHKGDLTFAKVKAIATENAKGDDFGYRTEFLKLIDQAQQLTGQP